MKATAFRNGYLSVLHGAWAVAPVEKRLAASALRRKRVSVRHAFGTTTERLARAYEAEAHQHYAGKN